MAPSSPSRTAWRLAAAVAFLGGCQSTPPDGEYYYDRMIQPILAQSCARGTSGCHAADPGDPFAFAAGNLDVTSYDMLRRRPDLLRTYGPFPAPMLLLKAVAQTDDLAITYRDQALPSRIAHAGGAVFRVSSPAFLALQYWLDSGATRSGMPPAPAPVAGTGDCPTAVPPGFDPATVTSTPEWQAYAGDFGAVRDVIVSRGCAAGSCHGAPAADFYFTCGDDLPSKAFAFKAVQSFVATPVERSPILTIPSLGSSHTGGVYFTPDDHDFVVVRDFAAHVGAVPFGAGDPRRTFFADHVMPVLLSRGCAAEGCHSPAAMNDFKLRAGAPGAFPAIQLEKNYQIARDEFMALELPDPRRGRLIAKNVTAAHGGIAHRGGPLLEEGAAPTPPRASSPTIPRRRRRSAPWPSGPGSSGSRWGTRTKGRSYPSSTSSGRPRTSPVRSRPRPTSPARTCSSATRPSTQAAPSSASATRARSSTAAPARPTARWSTRAAPT